MRRTGLYFIALGGVVSLVTFFLRQTAWFAAEQADMMSDVAEIVESCFWGGLIFVALGLLIFLRSLKKAKPEQEEETVQVWYCNCCGAENDEDSDYCQNCGAPYGSLPEEQTFVGGDWICPWCGRVCPESAAICTACGYNRLEDGG